MSRPRGPSLSGRVASGQPPFATKYDDRCEFYVQLYDATFFPLVPILELRLLCQRRPCHVIGSDHCQSEGNLRCACHPGAAGCFIGRIAWRSNNQILTKWPIESTAYLSEPFLPADKAGAFFFLKKKRNDFFTGSRLPLAVSASSPFHRPGRPVIIHSYAREDSGRLRYSAPGSTARGFVKKRRSNGRVAS